MSKSGLTHAEASRLLAQNGLNTIAESNEIKPFEIFLSQFKSVLIGILIVAGVIAYLLGDPLDTIFIVIIIFLNAVFGFIQEFRAEKAIKALKKLVTSQIRVLRDGKETLLDAKYLVVGDLIILEEGNKVPADCQLLDVHGLEVDEAPLTGESIPIPKVVDGDEEEGQVFLGTTIVKGHAKAAVIATGSNTRFGKIATLLKNIEDEKTPLQKQLDSLGKTLAYIALAATGFIFLLGVVRGQELFNMLLTSVSLSVAVVPEGLPAVLTITLALGVQRMVKRAAIVRKLNSIETLGSTNVICTDKTGTLTKNEMTVKNVWIYHQLTTVTETGKSKQLDKLIEIGILDNNANAISKIDDQKLEIVGEKTEGSLLTLAHQLGFSIDGVRNNGNLVEEFPFDSNLKTMTVVWQKGSSREILSKGAPETILANSKYLLTPKGKTLLTDKLKKEVTEQIDQLAKQGQRVMGFGYKPINESKLVRKEAESDLIFVGLVGIADPLRDEIREAISLARLAGIRTIMITGDNSLTAKSIALEAGIITPHDEVFWGPDLLKLSDSELAEVVNKYSVFARTNPIDKNKIVTALRQKGYIVAVTGDGVNDAPALKAADVGVAMGITGTDVAKETADIILTDDNYASLVTAVEEGRVIYDNIIKSTKFLLSSNSSELLAILAAVFLGIPLPLTPIQILWINLVTDSLPALALATDPKDPEVMKRLPRDKTLGLIQLIDPYWLVKVGMAVAGITVIVFLATYRYTNVEFARTVSFTLIIALQLGIALLVRRGHRWHTNRKLLLAIGLILLMQVAIVAHPTLNKIFDIGW